ncbi:MAG: c-type cytochrome [Opitutales bacterium]
MPRRLVTLMLLLGAASAPAAEDGALLYAQNCAACHLPDQMVVGPSLIEISKLYGKKPKEFVEWAIKPQKKRNNVIEMPSMGHLGEANLLAIREHMIRASQGLKEKKAALADPFARTPRRPEVQRIFLPNSGPAAIAVALPGDLAFCFDAGRCQLRSVWRGNFLKAWDYWKGNGKAQVVRDGEVVWEAAAEQPSPAVRFLGYTVDETGLPTFEYVRDGATFRETMTAAGKRLTRSFVVETDRPVELPVDPAAVASAGRRTQGLLRLTPAEARAFTLTLELR